MKKKYILLALILSVINIHTISAACTQEELTAFKKVENKYTIKKEFDSTTKTYNIYLENQYPNDYFYRIYSDDKLQCSEYDETSMKCVNFKPGSYDVEIMSFSNTCTDALKEMTLTLAEYNTFADDPLCDGIEEFVLCNPTYSKELDYDTFVSRVNTYRKTKLKKEEPKQPVVEEKETFLDIALDYLQKNLIQIIIVLVFIVLLTITIVITAKSIRKSRRLE